MSFVDRLKPANAARRARIILKNRTYSSAQGRRRGDAVWRHSQYAGETETRAWRHHNVFSAKERDKRNKAVSEWNYASKEKGENWGPLGPSGERFFDSLMGERDFASGRLDLSIRTIAYKLTMCVATVTAYIKRLVDLGLLVKLRRSKPVDDPQPGGPRVEQLTNAYWFTLPPEIAARVRELLADDPKPADQETHEQEQADQLAAMLATLSAEEFAKVQAGNYAPLTAALLALGKTFDEKNRAILTARM